MPPELVHALGELDDVPLVLADHQTAFPVAAAPRAPADRVRAT